ncbi:MAG: nucleotidyltransferase domain-containing protein [Planctomycetaceae bacterium]|nr:nucleotidyltransferase domain-containing protein [Planctomycetaceae bacterium]
MARSRQEILLQLKSAKPGLEREFPLRRLALFGSWAREEASANSDVDLLVEVDPSIGLRFVTLAERLEAVLGQRVDLVSQRAIRPRLWKLIEPELIDV